MVTFETIQAPFGGLVVAVTPETKIGVPGNKPCGFAVFTVIVVPENVIALAEMQRRESEASNAKAELRASQDQLIVQGMNKASINRLAKTGVIESINNVTATIPGEVVERKINKGQVVQPSDALYTIANLDVLWAIAQVPETNAPLIKKGQKSEIQVSALNNKKIESEVSYVSSIVNPETRTVVVRAEIDNTNRQLKPGMLATMLVESEPVDIVTVPSEAIVRDDNTDHLFIKIDNETFVPHLISKYGREFSIVEVPYCFKLLLQELASMQVHMRLITADNIESLITLGKKSLGNLSRFTSNPIKAIS